MVSNIEVHLPDKPITIKSIGGYLKGPHRKLWNEDLFLKYDKNRNVNLILDPLWTKYLPSVTKLLRSLVFHVLSKVTVLMHGILFYTNVQMGDLRYKVFILISTTVPCTC